MKNQLKTVLLLGMLMGIMLLVGQAVGGTEGLTFALVIAIAFNFGAYWFSDKIVLSMYRAKKIEKSSGLFKQVAGIAEKMGIPAPDVYIIDTANPNAFATGRGPNHASVALTSGILDILDEKELRGVIAHELSHVKNRDTLVSTIAATIAASISYIAYMARWAAIFGGVSGNGERRSSGLELVFLWLLAPFIAALLQFAISRSREYLADKTAAETLKDKEGLSSALIKIEASSRQNPLRFGNSATASLFIINPFKGVSISELFSTHPKTEKRIEQLRGLMI